MFDDLMIEKLKKEMAVFFKELGSKNNIEIEISEIDEENEILNLKIEISMNQRQMMKNEREFFKEHCEQFGLQPIHYLHEFEEEDEEGESAIYEVCGFSINSTKKPIKARNVETGEIVFFAEDIVDNILDTTVKVASSKFKETPKMLRRVTKREQGE